MGALASETQTTAAPRVTGNLKWRAISAAMRTVGRTSRGIHTGYRYGFDSGVMLDLVYENRPDGRYLIGPIIDRFYLNALGWRAIRARKELLKQILVEQICALAWESPHSRAAAEAGQMVLVDLAAGPGRYLIEAFHALQSANASAAGRLTIICRDLSTHALQYGETLAKAL